MDMITHKQTASAANSATPCDFAVAGESNLMCEAILQNVLAEEAEAAQFPIAICHSPDDDVVPFDTLPDLEANPNLSLFNILGVVNATGDHYEAILICLFGSVLPHTTFQSQIDTNSVQDLDDTSMCPALNGTFVGKITSAPAAAPTSGALSTMSFASSVALVIGSLVLTMSSSS
jgi:hypothetical protein